MPREGFALLTVLWVLTGMAALSMLLTMTARESIGAARNRVSSTRAQWAAEGCAERARAVIDLTMRAATDPDASWATLNRSMDDAMLTRGCRITLVPAGRQLDVNTATADQLRRVLLHAGAPTGQSDSIVDAIIDWRDGDDAPQRDGAEAEWYRMRDRVPPRNGSFMDGQELRLVRGLETMSGLGSLFGVDRGRIALSHAPAAVLAALPGFGSETIVRVLELREAGRLVSLEALTGTLSRAAREQLLADQGRLTASMTVAPDAWVMSSSATAGIPLVTVGLELRLVRSGRRAAVIGRRSHRWS